MSSSLSTVLCFVACNLSSGQNILFPLAHPCLHRFLILHFLSLFFLYQFSFSFFPCHLFDYPFSFLYRQYFTFFPFFVISLFFLFLQLPRLCFLFFITASSTCFLLFLSFLVYFLLLIPFPLSFPHYFHAFTTISLLLFPPFFPFHRYILHLPSLVSTLPRYFIILILSPSPSLALLRHPSLLCPSASLHPALNLP